jgi:hypothetical protein
MKTRNLVIGTLLMLAVASPASALSLYSNQQAGIKVNAKATLGTTSTSTHVQTKAEMKANIEANLAERKAAREEFTAKIANKIGSSTGAKGGFLGNIAGQRVKNIYRLFEATINRFEKLITRIESRLTKIKDAGGVTTEAEVSLLAAKDSLAKAEANLVLLGNLGLGKGSTTKATSTASTTDSINLDQAKSLATQLRDNLRDVKESLMKTVRSLVEVQKTVKVSGNATSTATTTNSND